VISVELKTLLIIIMNDYEGLSRPRIQNLDVSHVQKDDLLYLERTNCNAGYK